MDGPVDYLSGLGVLPDPLKAIQEQLAFKVGIDAKQAQAARLQADTAETVQKLTRAQQFEQDAAAVGQNPDPQAISSLITKYPEFADQLKAGWDVKDKAAKDADLTQLGEIYSAASSGNWDLALKSAQARVDADRAAGHADEGDQQFVDQVTAASQGDENAKRAVLTSIGTHLAAVTGPEHFASVYGALKGGYTLGPGEVRMDDNNQVIGHSPLIKGDDGALYDWNVVMGGEAAEPSASPASAGNITPAAQSVATALASTGLPGPVIAGFMGNFHAEGGYEGAQGDGGSASGIAQWRGGRAANFEKVIGKPVTEATHAEQAQFIAWEMAHPEEAGMTVEQRNAILSAKTPAQAAALIDKFYERSSGRDRRVRMSAATAFASAAAGDTPPHPSSGGLKPLLPGKSKDAPSGYRYTDSGSLEPIPGGPADKPKAGFRLLTPAEKKAERLDVNTQYQVNTDTGQITALGGQQRQAKQIPQGVISKVQPSIDIRDTMARLKSNWKDDYGGHTVLGGALNTVQGVVDVGPQGMRDWWADFQSMDNLVRNQLFGSALTEHEKQAYAATTITPRMAPDQIKKNLQRRFDIIKAVTARQQGFLKKNGYDPEAVDALFQPLGGPAGGEAPVQVRSVQEARKLAPGTLYLAPDGKVRRR